MDRLERENRLTRQIIGAAIEVHRTLGPGMLESVYELCLENELQQRGVEVERQRALPVIYRGVQLDGGFRIDLLVANLVVVELKAVEKLEPIFRAQLLSYLRLTKCKVGLLINFNVQQLTDGLERFVL